MNGRKRLQRRKRKIMSGIRQAIVFKGGLEAIGERCAIGLLKPGEGVGVVKSETNSDEKRQSNREILWFRRFLQQKAGSATDINRICDRRDKYCLFYQHFIICRWSKDQAAKVDRKDIVKTYRSIARSAIDWPICFWVVTVRGQILGTASCNGESANFVCLIIWRNVRFWAVSTVRYDPRS